MLDDLKEVLTIPSVLGAALPDAPFGIEPKRALDWFLQKAESYGLKTGRIGGWCGWCELGNEQAPMTGILCHLDVVPAGEGWSVPPYDLTVENGRLYGRGIVDDKGPAVACLHVLKRLKEQNTPLNRRVRLIVGCNEENGSACIKKYVAEAEIPSFSFVPDADFPIINSEKGIAEITLSLTCDRFFAQNLTAITAGIRSNVVPDRCEAVIKNDSPLHHMLYQAAETYGADQVFNSEPFVKQILECGWRPDDFSAHIFPDRIVLEARGIAGHAMAPHKGENAFWKLLDLLSVCPDAKDSALLTALRSRIGSPLAAQRLGIDFMDEDSGALTINCGKVLLSDDKLTLTLNLRLPISASIESVRENIRTNFGFACRETLVSFSPNLFIQPDSPLIATLLAAYTETTGDKGYCVRCGGGTYARELPNAVAFGPTFPGAETNIHNADENISVAEFEKLPDIYRAAILKLDKLKA